jgi:HEAT repeat protein
MSKGREEPITIDLDYFLLHVHLPERKISFSLDFSKKPRPFHLAVIAFVVSEMKKNNNMKKISLKENIKDLELLDKKLLEDTKYISETQHDIFVKVTTAWKKRIKFLYKGGLFDLIYHVKDPFEDRVINKSPTYDEKDFWGKLIKIWGSHQNASLKFAVDAVDLTLDDVKIKFKDKEENAWKRFYKSLQDKKSNDTKRSESDIDPKLQLKAEVCRFFKDLEKRFKYLKILHTQQKVTIDDQFEPIQVTPERMRWGNVESFWEYSESEKELERAYTFKNIEETSLHRISWNEAKKMSRRIMVLADPGMGKTTLLKMEATTIAQQEREKLEKNEITIDEAIFPILLRLSDFSKSDEAIFNDILKLVKRKYKRISRQILDILKIKIETEKCILFFDALDEVSIEDRNILSEKLNDFIDDYPCQIICTSRIVGYPGFFLDRAKEVEIVPYNQEQIENYVKKWFESAVDTIKDKSVSAAGLLQELQYKPQIGGLAQNPLILSLLCSLYQEKDLELPTRRCIVFQKSVDFMLSKWSRKRKQQSEGRIEAKRSLLEEMAYHFSCKGKEIFTLKELLIFTKEYIQEGKVLTDFSDPDSIITELSENDGIFIKLEREENRYIFLHRTFQEYLTASFLANTFEVNQTEGRETIREHYWDFDWHETIAVLTGLLTNPITLLEDINEQEDDIFSSLLVLAGRCIAECDQHYHPLIDDVIKRLFKLWYAFPRETYITSALVIAGHWNSLVPKLFLKALNDKDNIVGIGAAWALAKIGNPESIQKLILALGDEDSEVRGLAAWAFGQIGNPESIQALKQALGDEDSIVRGMAAWAFGQIGNPESIQALIQALGDEDSEVRVQAAWELRDFGSSESIPAFTQALTDEDSQVRALAAEALGKIGSSESIPALIQALADEDREVRREAAWAFGQIGNSESIQVLTQALSDDNSEVRVWAARALGWICSSDSIPALTQALTDEDRKVRVGAARALGEIGSPESIPALIQILADEDRKVRREAAWAFGQIGNPESIQALIQALGDEDFEVRLEAARSLREIDSSESIQALIQALGDEDRKVRVWAARALGEIGSPESIPALTQALGDEDSQVRALAAEALGKIGSPESIPALTQALADEDRKVRREAAWAFGQIGNPESIQALKQALGDEDSEVRVWAVKALGRIGNSESIPALIQALSDENSEVRVWAARALGWIGSSDSIPALTQALGDEDSQVRALAVSALGQIGSSEGVPAAIQALGDTNRKVRRCSALALGEIGSPESIPALTQALGDEDREVRVWAAEALGEIDSSESIQALTQALVNTDKKVRERASFLLEKIDNLDILKKLISSSEIDINKPKIFRLARVMAIRYCKEEKNEKIDFIPVYAKVIEKYRSTSGSE